MREPTPADILEKAMHIGGHRSVFSSLRRRGGRPGEIIERLSPEDREVLRELRSDDISPDHAPRYAGYL